MPDNDFILVNTCDHVGSTAMIRKSAVVGARTWYSDYDKCQYTLVVFAAKEMMFVRDQAVYVWEQLREAEIT